MRHTGHAATFCLLLSTFALGARAQEVPADLPDAPVLVPPQLPDSQHGHPAYPEGGDGRPARVLLELLIDADGRVSEANVLEVDREGTDAERFGDAAIGFASELRFDPALRDGSPVAARVRFAVLFQPPVHEHPVSPHEHEHEHAASEHVHAPDGVAEHEHARGEAPDVEEAPSTPAGPEVFGATARTRAPHQATSSVELDGEDVRLRPYGSTGDLLNAAPGFYVIQHAGGGKANQYFLRGFDADHGTDVALHVDGVPINHVSHGHGQGYTDLQWVIPELIERIEIRKGPYFAEYGDFATAGAVNVVLYDRPERSSVTLGGGTYGTFRGVGILSPEVRDLDVTLAAEAYGSDGPFENDEDLRRINVFGRVGKRWGAGATATLTATSHFSAWNASGQIPSREVDAGRLDRFGFLDPNEGGSTQRHGLQAALRVPTGASNDGGFELSGWLAHYRFALYSNFTFFSADPESGDMIRQGDERLVGGLRGAYSFAERWGELRLATRAGLQVRYDAIDTSLHDAPGRERGRVRVDASVGQGSIGLFVEEQLGWRWFRAVAGARADGFNFHVQDELEDVGTLEGATSGEAQDVRLSPKLNLIFMPHRTVELFANGGYGFHSNDARGTVRSPAPVTPLTRALGYELGARVSWLDRFEVSAAGFALELDSETVWVGDEGTTEARGASRRLGLELGARAQVLPWLRLEADATWTDATFVDNPANARAIALAPTFLLDGALVVRHEGTGLSGRLGVLHLADRPATEDEFLEAEGFTRLDANIGWQQPRFALAVTAQNLTNARWRQAQFATTSRLATEEDVSACPTGTRAVEEGGVFEGCEDMNFTPGWPVHVVGTATLFF